MSESLPVGRACGRCGAQLILHVDVSHGEYTDSLTALLDVGPSGTVLVDAHCDCKPQTVALQAVPQPLDREN